MLRLRAQALEVSWTRPRASNIWPRIESARSRADRPQRRDELTRCLRQHDGRAAPSLVQLIVGEDEAEPAKGTLSYVSPVARAMMNKEVDDVVQAGSGEAEIVE